MFSTLLVKEMHETIISGRFILTAMVMVILIPLGLYVSLKDYQQRLSVYQDAVATYRQESEGKVTMGFQARGYRPPSPLSVFVTGIEPVIPNTAITTSIQIQLGERAIDNGIINITNESTLDNPLLALFGKLDFLFIVSTILSMLAFMFTFSSITGEKAQGTLKQIAANPVDRWSVLFSKIVGGFILFILPFAVACVIGLIMLNTSNVISLLIPGITGAILTIVGIMVVFLFCMFTLGMLVSASSRNAVNAFITLLFVWVFLALVIPKMSPMIARQFYQIQTRESYMRQLEATRNDIMKELRFREKDVLEKLQAKHGITETDIRNTLRTNMNGIFFSEYDELVAQLHEEYGQRLAAEGERIKRQYDNQCSVQQEIAMQISRISPVSCLTYALSAIASTGFDEVDRFSREAERFQDEYMREMHKYYEISWIGNNGMVLEKDTPKGLPVPQMDSYHHASLGEAVHKTWPDMLILALYTILFLAGAFVKFLRYDVR
jgi:ABC-type transport system involved in multi-copper enzyme maturation permease subunit